MMKEREMNETQIRGMRELWADVNTIVKKTYSARDFELQVAHRLVGNGNYAIASDGRHFVWDARFRHWAQWK